MYARMRVAGGRRVGERVWDSYVVCDGGALLFAIIAACHRRGASVPWDVHAVARAEAAREPMARVMP